MFYNVIWLAFSALQSLTQNFTFEHLKIPRENAKKGGKLEGRVRKAGGSGPHVPSHKW